MMVAKVYMCIFTTFFSHSQTKNLPIGPAEFN